ncbi:MAG: hypothetical protein LIV24_10225 [Eubacterium sp.]|nr:hypothetical protein [Eubacterium sp.]
MGSGAGSRRLITIALSCGMTMIVKNASCRYHPGHEIDACVILKSQVQITKTTKLGNKHCFIKGKKAKR